MVHFQKDYLYGIQQEATILPILQQHFGNTLARNKERWGKYDFYNENSIFELKSRKNKKCAYPTTLMTCNKVVNVDEKDLYFIFNFTDELTCIKYDPILFDTFEKKNYSRINQCYDEKEYYFIPIHYLETIKKYNSTI
jgi:hypothetical protein